jgi:hypothetical protein
MQVVDFLRVDRPACGREIGLFLVIAFQYHFVARGDQFFQHGDQIVGGQHLALYGYGCQAPLFSVRRVFQTRSGVCPDNIINLLIQRIILICLTLK